MTYDLTLLTDWIRRLGRDRIAAGRETFTSDGTGEVELTSTGSITLTQVTVDGDPVTLNTQVTLSNRVLTFTDPQDAPSGARIVVEYTNSGYTNGEVAEFAVDAARIVGSDLGIQWFVDVSGSQVTDIPDAIVVTVGAHTFLDATVEKLIALKAGLNMYTEKATRAADDAILVKDGDTLIDTSKAAAAGRNALERMTDEYATALKDALVRRQQGYGVEGS